MFLVQLWYKLCITNCTIFEQDKFYDCGTISVRFCFAFVIIQKAYASAPRMSASSDWLVTYLRIGRRSGGQPGTARRLVNIKLT